jgi:hypothetical protein
MNDTGILAFEDDATGQTLTLPFRVTGHGALGQITPVRMYKKNGKSKSNRFELTGANRVDYSGVEQHLNMVSNTARRKLPQWALTDSSQHDAFRASFLRDTSSNTAGPSPPSPTDLHTQGRLSGDDPAHTPQKAKTHTNIGGAGGRQKSVPSLSGIGMLADLLQDATEGRAKDEKKYTADKAEFQSQLATKTQAVKKHKATITQLHTQLTQHEVTADEDRKAARAHAAEIKGLKAQILDRDVKIVAKDAKLKEVQAANTQQQQAQLKQHQATDLQQQTRISKQQAQIKEQQGELKERCTRDKKLQGELKESEAAKNLLNAQNSQHEITIEDLKHQNKRRREEHTSEVQKVQRIGSELKRAKTELSSERERQAHEEQERQAAIEVARAAAAKSNSWFSFGRSA